MQDQPFYSGPYHANNRPGADQSQGYPDYNQSPGPGYYPPPPMPPQYQPYGQTQQDPGPFGAPGQQMMMDMAKNYGEQWASEGKKQLEKYVSVSKVKVYFAVDNAYVGKKLAVLLFPFAHRDWSMKFQGTSEEPVPPKVDVNAVDLYIPCMAFVTYIFTAGMVLGVHNKFTPEDLGLIATTALAWLVLENVVITVFRYMMSIAHALNVYDTIAFSGYKYVAMIVCLAAYLAGGKSVYYWTVLYFSVAIAYFLIRSVKSSVLPVVESQHNGKKRKLYLLLCISLSQPFVLYWLTSSVLSSAAYYEPQPPIHPLPKNMAMGAEGLGNIKM